jgi:hypothetical protein
MTDHGVTLSQLANRAPYVHLTPEQENRVLELIREINSIFDDNQAKKAS